MEERQKIQKVRQADGTTVSLKVSPVIDARQERAKALAKKREAESKSTPSKTEPSKP